MTLVSEIITQGYRDANIVTIHQSLSAAEMREGLARLQSLVASVYGFEVGENFQDWPLGNHGRSPQEQIYLDPLALTYPPINARIIATAEEAKTVYFPVSPSDGSRMMLIDPYSILQFYPVTLNGNGRTIESQPSLLLDDDGTMRAWIFDASRGDWLRAIGFVSTDQFPFPLEFDDYFIISLAMRINPRNGRTISPESAKRFKDQEAQLFARYQQSAPLAINSDLSRTSRQGYQIGWTGDYSSQQAFDRGSPYGWPY